MHFYLQLDKNTHLNYKQAHVTTLFFSNNENKNRLDLALNQKCRKRNIVKSAHKERTLEESTTNTFKTIEFNL